jgi:hypothetical protein
MLRFILIFTILFSFGSFSGQVNAQNFTEDQVLTILDQQVSPSQTCMDEYLKRSKQIKRFLIWAPPITVVGAPVAGYTLGIAASYTAGLVATVGWDALGYAIMGLFVGFTGTAVTGVTLETVHAVKYFNNKNIMELIAFSHADNIEHKRITKFIKKYNRKFPNDNLLASELTMFIRDYDSRGLLCDNSIRQRKKVKKLKHKLARRRDIMRYIHNELLGR